jgi:hypothetical protein
MKTKMAIDAGDFLSGMKPHAIRFLRNNIISVREELSSGHATRCHICDNVGLSIEAKDITFFASLHQVDCKDCNSQFVVFRYCLEATKEHTARRTKVHPIVAGHDDCQIQLRFDLSHQTLQDRLEYVTPEVTELSERTEEHHVSYEPEITLPLCSSCHGRVHRDGEFQALQPKMTRTEWES